MNGLLPANRNRHQGITAVSSDYTVFLMLLLVVVGPRLSCSLTITPPRALLRLRHHGFASYSSSSTLLLAARKKHDEDGAGDLGTPSSSASYARPVVQWYPGHIAKAERELAQTLKLVDVVVEVRDARAVKATSHPFVGTWCAGRPRIVAFSHLDLIPPKARLEWQQYLEQFGADQGDQPLDRRVENQVQQARLERSKYNPSSTNATSTDSSTVEAVLFVNAAQGTGIAALKRAVVEAGEHVQERRRRRGLLPRPLRVGLLGYPNVGKSTVLNKLLGRKKAKTSNKPGVTRTLQWIRVKDANDMELLDSPGVIPASLVDQSDATLLAACNCIGEAAYDDQAVAAYLCEWLLDLYRKGDGKRAAPEWRVKCQNRYKLDPLLQDNDWTGEDMVFAVADNTCQGNPEDAARRILQDFRCGRMGPICLQPAPPVDQAVERPISIDEGLQLQRIKDHHAREQERARLAVETAKERGLELPPIVDQQHSKEAPQVGKGLFEGW